MIYLPELHYFFDQKDFPLEQAVLVTAETIGMWCTHYKAELIVPLKGIKETKREGKLPQAEKEKRLGIKELVHWLFSYSEIQGLFSLFLDSSPIGQGKDQIAKFDHHDDTCCWVLNITEEEFDQLQKAWEEEGLPKDLFYPEGQEVRITKFSGLIGRLFGKLGFSKIYTPRQWEQEKKKSN